MNDVCGFARVATIPPHFGRCRRRARFVCVNCRDLVEVYCLRCGLVERMGNRFIIRGAASLLLKDAGPARLCGCWRDSASENPQAVPVVQEGRTTGP